MANKGNLVLDIDALVNMYDTVSGYQTTFEDALYKEYKNSYKLSVSNYYRGNSADQFKQYLKDGCINMITETMDVSSSLTDCIQIFAEAFYQFENTHDGRVAESAVNTVEEFAKTKEQVLTGMTDELNEVLHLASQYISASSLPLDAAHGEYKDVHNSLEKMRDTLYSMDDEAVRQAQDLHQRITHLKTMLQSLMSECYTSDGMLIPDHLAQVTSKDWYTKAANVSLYIKMQEDPFQYSAGEVTLSEDQWAAGLFTDMYVYAGYKIGTASYEAGVEDNTAFVNAQAAAAQGNAHAEICDFLALKGDAQVNVAYAGVDAKAGFSDKYMGFSVDAKAGLVDVNGSVILGSDKINAYVKGEAHVLTAEGKVAYNAQENGQYEVGIDASASAAGASVSGGTTLLAYKDQANATSKSRTLLGFKVGAAVDAGGEFECWSESKTAYETEYVNVNATSFNVGAGVLFEGGVEVTIPTLYVKKLW